MMAHTSYRLASSALAVATALISSAAAAQTAPAEQPAVATPADAPALPADIIVTAQRRAERSVDVPITITSVSAQQLSDANVTTLADVARVAPAVRFDATGSFVQPSVRGVGTGVVSAGGGANVGIYTDGFYSPNPLAADFQLMNIKSVDVLKGPQGTLFGRNTTGGAILVTTAEPGDTPGLQVKASYGSFNAQRYQGYASTSIASGVAFDVEGLFSKGDGYVTNLTTGNKKAGAYQNWSVRTGLKIDVAPGVSLLLRYGHNDTDDPATMLTNIFSGYIGAPGLAYGVGTGQPASLYTTRPGTVVGTDPFSFTLHANYAQATFKADLGFGDLTSYTQYRVENSLQLEDLDATAATIANGGLSLHNGVFDKTFSQELLLSSKPGGALQWTTGLFYFRTRDSWDIAIGYPFLGDPNGISHIGRSSATTESYAAFADLTYQFTPKLFLTAGGRFSHDVVKDAFYTNGAYPAVGFPPDLSGNKFTPRAVLRFKPDRNSSIYASFAKGYKAAVLDVGNIDPTVSATDRRVKPEDLTAYEVGYKYDDRVLSLDLSGYYYDYKNLQVSVYYGAAQARILNAATSRIYGLEGQGAYRIGSHFSFNAGAAYTHARYVNFPQAPVFIPLVAGGPLTPTTIPVKDAHMQRVPDFTGNVGARYATDLGGGQLAVSTNFYYSGSFFFGPSGTQFKQNGYGILGLRAEWTDPSKKYTLAVYGDNLTGIRYRTQLIPNGFAIGNTWNAPATWGVSVSAKL